METFFIMSFDHQFDDLCGGIHHVAFRWSGDQRLRLCDDVGYHSGNLLFGVPLRAVRGVADAPQTC